MGELQVNALTRKLQLIEEETKRVNDRLAEVLDKLGEVEKNGEENERKRKVLEAQSFANEEKYEIQDAQLLEAKTIAEDATHKQDEVARKLKEVEEQAGICAEKEDKYEESVRTLSSNLNNEESRAEFAERTVDKLESTIDKLQEDLFNEKHAFIEMSKKLDQTLNDMMNI